MGWLSDITGGDLAAGFFTPEGLQERALFFAPLAAGAAMGPAGYAGATAALAAGATTGAGIAALQGGDVMTGALTGGLSGMTGGSLSAAFAPGASFGGAEALSTAGSGGSAAVTEGVSAAGQGTMAGFNPGNTGLQAYGGSVAPSSQFASNNLLNAGAGTTAPSLSLTRPPDTSFSAGLGRYGGGDAVYGGGIKNQALGGARLASTGLAAMGASAGLNQEPVEYETPDKYKYDPTRRLDLNRDTGIDAALKKDSGLRLIASGGYIGNNYAGGGYLEGGGVGDGMSDDIPANIDGEQEAALSEGEFVIPADVVSHIGNGSSNAGARRLYDMMATIREARTGNSKQGIEIEAEEYMPYNMVESQSQRF